MLGHVSQAVHSAQEALSSIESFNPDIMLIDIGLQDIDGYQLVQQLAQLSSGKDVRKIALTVYGQPDDKQRALEAGFDKHLVKPVEAEKLEMAIDANES